MIKIIFLMKNNKKCQKKLRENIRVLYSELTSLTGNVASTKLKSHRENKTDLKSSAEPDRTYLLSYFTLLYRQSLT